jgi:hypothetical protein
LLPQALIARATGTKLNRPGFAGGCLF